MAPLNPRVPDIQVLQCVAVCCSVLQCDAVRCSVLQCVPTDGALVFLLAKIIIRIFTHMYVLRPSRGRKRGKEVEIERERERKREIYKCMYV